jgi:hypothetical protein
MIDLSIDGRLLGYQTGPLVFLSDYKDAIGYANLRIGDDEYTPHSRGRSGPKETFMSYSIKDIWKVASVSELRLNNRDLHYTSTDADYNLRCTSKAFAAFFNFLRQISYLDEKADRHRCALSNFLTMRFKQKTIEMYIPNIPVWGEFEQNIQMLLQEYMACITYAMKRPRIYAGYSPYYGNESLGKDMVYLENRARKAYEAERKLGTTKSFKEAKLKHAVALQFISNNPWNSYNAFDSLIRQHLDLYHMDENTKWVMDIEDVAELGEEKGTARKVRNLRVNNFMAEVITTMLQEAEEWTW